MQLAKLAGVLDQIYVVFGVDKLLSSGELWMGRKII